MTLEEIITKELQQVKEHKAVYEVECNYYGNDYVNDNKEKFDCVAQLEYHQRILDCLIEVKQRRENND